MSPDITDAKVRHTCFLKYVNHIDTDTNKIDSINPSKLVKLKAKILAIAIEDKVLEKCNEKAVHMGQLLGLVPICPNEILPSISQFYANQRASVSNGKHCLYGAVLAKAGYTVTRLDEIYRLHARNGTILHTEYVTCSIHKTIKV